MSIILRKSQHQDIPFLRQMLYEAVFWRVIADPNTNNPPFEKGLADPNICKAIAEFGERDGDTAVVAVVDSNPAGVAWYRFYNDDNFIRGYIQEAIPVIVIAVHRGYRRRGIGEKMINWLIDHASSHNIPKISLMVSKDNYAINLYNRCGFLEYADKEDSLLMLRNL